MTTADIENKEHLTFKLLNSAARFTGGIISHSPSMQSLLALARRVAKVDLTLLITGESGTGKERFARFIHHSSSRRLGPFIAVNCGAIAETLLDSELFGHARGAFTGAILDRPGLFEAANGGTILLDEIGDMTPGLQVKLLRVLQEREVRRIGENRSRPIDVRVITATNKNLISSIAAGLFRQDLFYRINVVELHIPPLRDRREDILPLAQLLLTEAAQRFKHAACELSPRAANQLQLHDWPGNVRELENAIERAVALAPSSLTQLDDLPHGINEPFPISTPILTLDAVRPLSEIEQDYILSILALNHGNQTHTAQQLQIGSATLYRKLRSYGLVQPRIPAAPPPH